MKEITIEEILRNGTTYTCTENLTIKGNIPGNAKINVNEKVKLIIDGSVEDGATIKAEDGCVIEIGIAYKGTNIKVEDGCVIKIGIAYKGANIKVEDGCVIKISEDKGANIQCDPDTTVIIRGNTCSSSLVIGDVGRCVAINMSGSSQRK